MAARSLALAQGPASKHSGQAVKPNLPANVEIVSDIVYASYGGRKLLLDLYLPKPRPAKPLAGVIAIRGGGWTEGDKGGFGHIAAGLASRGLAAVSIEYRTTKEVKFVNVVQDCKAAVRWMRAEGSQYGIRPNAIGAIGGSAGGHLVALLGTSYKASDLEGDGGHAGVSSRVQAVVAMAPVTDFFTLNPNDPDLPRLFHGDTTLEKSLSPVTYLDSDSAAILLLHGTADHSVPYQQSVEMLERSKKAGVRAELVGLEGAPHAFWNPGKWHDETIERAATFFHSVLDQAPTD
jgi:acetyl esterase/lipase